MKFNEQHMELFNNVVYVVEATGTERHDLWVRYSNQSDRPMKGPTVEWKPISSGRNIQIGTIAKRPICVDISWAMINNRRVLFFEGVSELVDHKMISDWITHFFGTDRRTNADNFGNCLDACGVYK